MKRQVKKIKIFCIIKLFLTNVKKKKILPILERNEIPELGTQHDLESTGGLVDGRKKKRRMEGRNCCARCCCCACCLPVWATYIVWFIIISIIIVIVVIGSIAGTFVMPTIDIGDITSSPTEGSQITFAGDGLNINFGLVIKVNNPNLLSIDLSDIEAVVSSSRLKIQIIERVCVTNLFLYI